MVLKPVCSGAGGILSSFLGFGILAVSENATFAFKYADVIEAVGVSAVLHLYAKDVAAACGGLPCQYGEGVGGVAAA